MGKLKETTLEGICIKTVRSYPAYDENGQALKLSVPAGTVLRHEAGGKGWIVHDLPVYTARSQSRTLELREAPTYVRPQDIGVMIIEDPQMGLAL